MILMKEKLMNLQNVEMEFVYFKIQIMQKIELFEYRFKIILMYRVNPNKIR